MSGDEDAFRCKDTVPMSKATLLLIPRGDVVPREGSVPICSAVLGHVSRTMQRSRRGGNRYAPNSVGMSHRVGRSLPRETGDAYS